MHIGIKYYSNDLSRNTCTKPFFLIWKKRAWSGWIYQTWLIYSWNKLAKIVLQNDPKLSRNTFLNHSFLFPHINDVNTSPWPWMCLLVVQVLYFCVGFWELSHLTRDLSQAEKKITVVTRQATDKMTIIFTQNNNFDHFEWNRCHFVHLLSL